MTRGRAASPSRRRICWASAPRMPRPAPPSLSKRSAFASPAPVRTGHMEQFGGHSWGTVGHAEKNIAVVAGLVVAGGAEPVAAAEAGAGCQRGGFFRPIGCAIRALVGGLLGAAR